MALVRYLGPFDQVTFDPSPGAAAIVDRGGTVELPDDVAASLVAQESFEYAAPVKAAKADIVKEA